MFTLQIKSTSGSDKADLLETMESFSEPFTAIQTDSLLINRGCFIGSPVIECINGDELVFQDANHLYVPRNTKGIYRTVLSGSERRLVDCRTAMEYKPESLLIPAMSVVFHDVWRVLNSLVKDKLRHILDDYSDILENVGSSNYSDYRIMLRFHEMVDGSNPDTSIISYGLRYCKFESSDDIVILSKEVQSLKVNDLKVYEDNGIQFRAMVALSRERCDIYVFMTKKDKQIDVVDYVYSELVHPIYSRYRVDSISENTLEPDDLVLYILSNGVGHGRDAESEKASLVYRIALFIAWCNLKDDDTLTKLKSAIERINAALSRHMLFKEHDGPVISMDDVIKTAEKLLTQREDDPDRLPF